MPTPRSIGEAFRGPPHSSWQRRRRAIRRFRRSPRHDTAFRTESRTGWSVDRHRTLRSDPINCRVLPVGPSIGTCTFLQEKGFHLQIVFRLPLLMRANFPSLANVRMSMFASVTRLRRPRVCPMPVVPQIGGVAERLLARTSTRPPFFARHFDRPHAPSLRFRPSQNPIFQPLESLEND